MIEVTSRVPERAWPPARLGRALRSERIRVHCYAEIPLPGESQGPRMQAEIQLPEPQRTGTASLEDALDRRRSCREFRADLLSLSMIGQCLWAVQGLNRHGTRTAPSAGARYPLEIYAIQPEGVARYDPKRHVLLAHRGGDRRAAVCRAALDQEFVREAPLTILICAVYARVESRYGSPRGSRYVDFEIGHAAQNVLLQAAALGLGSVPVGAFEDHEIQQVLELPEEHAPRYLLPIGHPR